MWEVLKNFKFSVHETSNPAILRLQGAGTMVTKCELVL